MTFDILELPWNIIMKGYDICIINGDDKFYCKITYEWRDMRASKDLLKSSPKCVGKYWISDTVHIGLGSTLEQINPTTWSMILPYSDLLPCVSSLGMNP